MRSTLWQRIEAADYPCWKQIDEIIQTHLDGLAPDYGGMTIQDAHEMTFFAHWDSVGADGELRRRVGAALYSRLLAAEEAEPCTARTGKDVRASSQPVRAVRPAMLHVVDVNTSLFNPQHKGA